MRAVSIIFEKMKTYERLILSVVMIVVMLAGTVYSITLSDKIRYADENEYITIAEHLTTVKSYSLDGIHPTASRPPGYPLFLGLLRFLGLATVHFRIINFILLTASIYLFYLILQGFASRYASIIGILLVGIYPVFFYTAGTLYPQTLGGFLFLVFLYLFLKPGAVIKHWILAGLIMGYLLLVIPTFIYVLGFALLGLMVFRKAYLHGIVIMLSVGAVLLPWTIRNYRVFHSFIPFSTNSGYNLLLGNSEHSTGSSGVNIDIRKYEASVRGLDEVETDRIYKHAAIKFISANKWRAFGLYLSKTLNYFNYTNELATRGEDSSRRDLILFLTYGPMLLLLLIRLFLHKSHPLKRRELFLIALYISNAFFQAIFVTRIRYRFPFDYLLITIDALLLSSLIQTYLSRNSVSGFEFNQELGKV